MKRLLTVILPILLAFTVCARADALSENRFIWEEANARMAAARAPEDFMAAADVYGKLVDRQVRNGPLFYNLGTALLMGGDHGEAVDALLRAERYGGSDPDIRRNLQLAMAGREGKQTLPPPWQRSFLFWHYGLSVPFRAGVAVCAFGLVWLAMILRLLGLRRLGGSILTPALAALVLFGSSVTLSLHRETEAETRTILTFEPAAALTETVEP